MTCEWWEYRGICKGCAGLVRYGEDRQHVACNSYIDTSWQSRVNPSNERWRPGYIFKLEKNSGYRTYACFYGIDINGKIQFQGGVRATKEAVAELEIRYEEQRPRDGNWYPGCELDNDR